MRILLATLALLAACSGCMQTRYAEGTARTGCTSNEFTYKERRWCGPWLAMPCKAEP